MPVGQIHPLAQVTMYACRACSGSWRSPPTPAPPAPVERPRLASNTDRRLELFRLNRETGGLRHRSQTAQGGWTARPLAAARECGTVSTVRLRQAPALGDKLQGDQGAVVALELVA